MQKIIKFTKKKMLEALLCTVFMPSFALAADKDEITDFSPAASSKIIQQKSKLEHDIDQGILTTLNYYQSAYPNSNFAKLDAEQSNKLRLLATHLKHEKGLDAGTALKQTLNELLLTSTPPIAITNVKPDTPQQSLIDQEVLTTLTYYQSAYPHSDFAKLDAEQSNKLRLLATRLKHEKGLDASTALKQALKIVNQITDRDAFEIMQDSGFSTKTITKPQAQELEAKIVGTLKNCILPL